VESVRSENVPLAFALIVRNPAIADRLVQYINALSVTRQLVPCSLLQLMVMRLRDSGYVPVLFDFQGPETRDLTETVVTLAHLSRFVIADLTDPSCVPHELRSFVADVAVPVVTLIEKGHVPNGT
jgi:hypothetical protein